MNKKIYIIGVSVIILALLISNAIFIRSYLNIKKVNITILDKITIDKYYEPVKHVEVEFETIKVGNTKILNSIESVNNFFGEDNEKFILEDEKTILTKIYDIKELQEVIAKRIYIDKSNNSNDFSGYLYFESAYKINDSNNYVANFVEVLN